jgi:hypothetical protein
MRTDQFPLREDIIQYKQSVLPCSFGRAFSPEKNPFLALPVLFKGTDAVFSAIASFLNRKNSSLVYYQILPMSIT